MMPLYSLFFCIFTMANIALPGTSSFVGEFLILLGIFKINFLACIFGTLGVILSGSYSLWLYNRICFGNLRTSNTLYYKDLDLKEFSILAPLLFSVIFVGIYPNIILKYIHFACTNYFIIFLT